MGVAVWTGCSVDDILQAPRGKRHDKPRGAGCRVEYGHDLCVIEQTLDSDLALHFARGRPGRRGAVVRRDHLARPITDGPSLLTALASCTRATSR